MHKEHWREQSDAERVAFAERVGEEFGKRMDLGRQRFPGDFEGDPLDHLDEELADALYYSHYARRQMAALEAEVARLRAERAEMRTLILSLHRVVQTVARLDEMGSGGQQVLQAVNAWIAKEQIRDAREAKEGSEHDD